jgi:hypothetical protein
LRLDIFTKDAAEDHITFIKEKEEKEEEEEEEEKEEEEVDFK